MYKIPKYSQSLIKANRLREGETIELKVKRLMANKEPIKDGAPLIYTERKDGVGAAYNIRTDRFELAAEAMDKVHRSEQARRDEIIKQEKEAKVVKLDKDGKAEPIHGEADKKQSN